MDVGQNFEQGNLRMADFSSSKINERLNALRSNLQRVGGGGSTFWKTKCRETEISEIQNCEY